MVIPHRAAAIQRKLVMLDRRETRSQPVTRAWSFLERSAQDSKGQNHD